MPSVGATINTILASVKAEGKTIIENAAKEPEIVSVATFLNNMGAKITGAGTSKIKIEGVKKLSKGFTEVIPDRIEAGTYLLAGALIGKKITLKNLIPKHIESLTSKLIEMGIDLEIGADFITVSQNKNLKPINIKTLVYPGFPTDLQQPLTVLLTQCNGTSILQETIYENRFQNVPYLNEMGAKIEIDEDRLPSRAMAIHEHIRQDGEKELERDAMALLWSAIAAGLSMGASLLAKGIFQVELEGVPGSFLLENLGYTFGFIIVIMARQQLFTENTVTAVLPVMQKPTMSNVGLLIRLWGVVLLGNILGTGIAAWAFEYMPIFNEETRDAFVKIGMDVMKNTPSEMFANAIISGWLIATMVWMFPAAGAAKIVVIILMTWLIALGDTTHIVVGSVEILYLVFNGTLHWSDFIWPFALPTLAGNICGGTFIFALMSHAQIRNDMSNKRKAEARQKAERAENIKKNYKNPA